MSIVSVGSVSTLRVVFRAFLTATTIAVAGCGGGADTQDNVVSAPTTIDSAAPSIPQDLVASAVSTTRVDLTWSAATDTGGSGLAGYRIFRNGSSTVLALTTTTSYTDTSVAPNTTYSYVVHAYDVAGNQSSASVVVTVTTPGSPPPADTTAPTAPQNLTATAISTTSIALNWTASSDAGGSGLAGYRIYRNGSTAVLATVTTTTYTDASAVANTTYSYVVRAIDGAANQSDISNSASATTPAPPPPPDTTAPSVPQNLNGAATAPTSIVLNWTPSNDTGGSGLAGYRIYRNGSATALATVPVGTTTYTDASVAQSTNYTFVVRAFDGAGNQSAASNSVSVTTPATPPPPDTTPPSVPQNLNASASNSTSIVLTWTASTDTGGSGVAGYRIYVNGSATPLVNVTTTTYTHSNLAPNTTFNYVVRAYDFAGNPSTGSNTATATTPGDTTAPSAPQNLSAVAISQSRVDLNWSAATDTGGSGLNGYRIFRNGSQIATVTTTSYSDTSLTASTAYSYLVRAVDGAGNVSAASNTATATTLGDTTAPSAPQNLVASAIDANRIDLTWSASTDTGGSGLAGYRIYRNGSTTALATVPTASYSDTSVAANATYTYVVRAYDNAGNESGASNSASARTPTVPDTTAPSVPQNLAAAAITSTRIDVSWSASTDTGGAGVAGYRIYRNGATTALATVTTTTYSDTSVAANTAYSYVVSAFDGAGNQSAASSPASATTPASTSGLDTRPSNTSCLAWARSGSQVQVQNAFPSLSFGNPIAMLQAPGVNTHWHLVQKTGVVRRFLASAATTSSTTFIDISGRVDSSANEGGLLGMAFHPNYPSDRRVFLSYTAQQGGQLTSRVSSFLVAANGETADSSNETVLLTVTQPAPNHNGGHIAFGPDGYLYIGFGDGGGSDDVYRNGQRMTTLLGKLLRIDVSAPTGYSVPSSNPFFNASNPGDTCPASGTRASGTCPEIYAYGLRNPWRWNFDRANGELWLADVGQNEYEEVDRITSGGNYGWSCREAAHPFNGSGMQCVGTTPIDPLAEYGRSQGQSITGGYVYRGVQSTPLVGRYIFGDFASGRIWAWIQENTTSRQPTQLADTNLQISSFAQGNDGELYALDYLSGTINRLVFQSTSGGAAPTLLSQTGCVNPSDAKQAASGLIPYDINAPFWSDGATKHRWIGLPNGQNITVGGTGDWDFPNGTVLMKQFQNSNSRLLETRLFMRHGDGTWGGFTYEWNAQQTDATLLIGGATRTIDGQTWIFPSEAECTQCHTRVAGNSLGLETSQLNRDLLYPQTNRTANQLTTLSSIGALTPAITNPGAQARLPSPTDTSAPVGDRARAYLHTNCSQCHRTSGPTPSSMDLRSTTALSATSACNVVPQLGDLGRGSAARLIAPGSAANSIVVVRASRRDGHGMPPIGSAQVDAAGVALLTEWINGLAGCQ